MQLTLLAFLTLSFLLPSTYADRKISQQQKQPIAKCATVTEKYSGSGNELCINRAQMVVQGFNESNLFVGCPATVMKDLVIQMAKAVRMVNEACKTAENKSNQTRLWADGWGALEQQFGGKEGISKLKSLYGAVSWGFTWGCGAEGRDDSTISRTLDAATTEQGHLCMHVLSTSVTDPSRDPASTHYWNPKAVYLGKKSAKSP
jgi:hypothetical protein